MRIPQINYKTTIDIFLGTLLIVPQILLIITKDFKKIFFGDSFYAESLRLFYLRLCEIAKGKDLYIKDAGVIKKTGFVYQSFLAIWLCYKFLGRKTYVLISSLVFIQYLVQVNNLEDGIYLSLIFICSSVCYFVQVERGNYQYFGIVLSLIATNMYTGDGITIFFSLMYILVIVFSISAFVLMSLVIGVYSIYITEYLDLLAVSALGFVTLLCFLLANYIYINGHRNRKHAMADLYNSIATVLTAVGLFKTKGNDSLEKSGDANLNFDRKRSLLVGVVSIFPFFLSGMMQINVSTAWVCIALVFVLFLNQSKLFRLFDYYFLYTWIFGFLLLSVLTLDLWGVVALIFIGSNPIFVYAMDSYNKTSSRGFKLLSPVYLTAVQRDSMIADIANSLPFRPMVLQMTPKIESYNDLWRDESLILEWIWTASATRNIKFYPDWFSLFMTCNPEDKLIKITKNYIVDANYYVISSFIEGSSKLFYLEDVFGKKIIHRYLPKRRHKDYFLLTKSVKN